jgi:D-arabinose 1-dehydrogenase-like Zn-dependent alcohol dehydrogenase
MHNRAIGCGNSNNIDALYFRVLTGVRPMVEIFSLDQAPLAFDKMMSGMVCFPVVLKIGGSEL